MTRQEELSKPLETHFIVTEKDRFATEQEIFLDAKRNIVKAAGPTELVYLDITPACGALIADSLAEDITNPTLISHAENYLDQSYCLIPTPNDMLALNLVSMPDKARRALARMGLQPALE